MIAFGNRQEDGVAIEFQPERGRRSIRDPRSHAAPRRSDATPVCGVTVLSLTASLLAAGVSLGAGDGVLALVTDYGPGDALIEKSISRRASAALRIEPNS